MSNWSLSALLQGMNKKVRDQLETGRGTLAHPGTKGDASESVWVRTLQTYLPKRYQVESAHVVDSEGGFSEQIDVLIFDRQYSPFVFEHEGAVIVPAESVYAAFEAKQTINADLVAYAQQKVASVRSLKQTSLPIPHSDGVRPAKDPIHILGGILTLDSDWSPPLGPALDTALEKDQEHGRLDIGCVAAHGYFWKGFREGSYAYFREGKPATAFIFRLISMLQIAGTVPMIDVQAYAEWLNKTD